MARTRQNQNHGLSGRHRRLDEGVDVFVEDQERLADVDVVDLGSWDDVALPRASRRSRAGDGGAILGADDVVCRLAGEGVPPGPVGVVGAATRADLNWATHMLELLMKGSALDELLDRAFGPREEVRGAGGADDDTSPSGSRARLDSSVGLGEPPKKVA